MKHIIGTAIGALCLMSTALSAADVPKPFITLRPSDSDWAIPELNEAVIGWAKKYPGFCDELWLPDDDLGRTRNILDKELEVFSRQRQALADAGIAVSFWQVTTLGHGAMPKESLKGIYRSDIPEDAWQVSENGERLYGMYCPRSPFVFALQKEYVKNVLRKVKPESYWLDDDLRMGIKKPNGCFCDRCLSEFNRENGSAFTREELVKRLFHGEELDPVRAAWSKFNAKSLAMFARASREAADEISASVLFGYQSVWADMVYTGNDFMPMFRALADRSGKVAGIRPGASYYSEWYPKEILFTKTMSVIRESERLRRDGFTGRITVEEENFPRKLIHKSAESIMRECSLMLASGCDSISLCWYYHGNAEPLSYFEHFAELVAKHRPYWEVLAASSRQTRLGGMARFAGSRRLEHKSFSLMEECEMWLSQCAIPYTVAEADPCVWWATKRTVAEMSEKDFEAFFAKPSVMTLDAFSAFAETYPEFAAKAFGGIAPDKVKALFEKAMREATLIKVDADGNTAVIAHAPAVPGVPPEKLNYGGVILSGNNPCAIVWREHPTYMLPVYNERMSLLDALDAIAGSAVPVRTNYYQALRLFPRMTKENKVDTFTIFNCSFGPTEALEIAIRRPEAKSAKWLMSCAEPIALESQYSEEKEELRVTLPAIPGWQSGTLIFE